MKTFVGLFLSSTAFGAVILVAYWLVAHRESTGSVLLAVMTVALAFAAGYALTAERNADLGGDTKDATYGASAGEDLGIFTTQSAWPILIALTSACAVAGVLWSPLLAVLSLVGLVLCLWRLGTESARVR